MSRSSGNSSDPLKSDVSAATRLVNRWSLDEVEAELARRSLRHYIEQAWAVVEPATPYTHGWHIEAICEHLEAVSRGEIRNLLINMPPRHMKSLTVSVFWPTWRWIDEPHVRWLFASYAESLSVRDALKSRRIIQSPWYQARWADRYQLSGDQNIKSRYENDKTGYRIATSVGGAATGEGGDIVVVDDPHNVKDAESDNVRKAALTWWDQVMSTRLNDPKTGSKVIVMQRVHEGDLSGHVLAQGGYEHLCLPTEYEPKVQIATGIGWKDPRESPGELLWPERVGKAEVADAKRVLGTAGFAAQHQQQPSPASGDVLKRSWWKFYQQPIPRTRFDEIIQSWDMTFKDSDGTDYVVGQVWGRRGADLYLLDQVRARMDFPATVAAVKSLTAKWPEATAKLVEDKANGPAVIAALKHSIPGLIPVEPQGSKSSRVAAVSPTIEAGNVYLPDPTFAPWIHDFIEECARFPRGVHDDQVDAMSQALLRMATPTARGYAGKPIGW